jgi:hypothetical protein
MTRVLCILGVDPGLEGAVAFYFPDARERVAVEDMPVAGRGVDGANLALRIAQLKPDLAIVEAVHAGQGWPGSRSFTFGFGAGVVSGVLAALCVPIHMVPPQTWKKYWKLNADKEQSRALALRLFPAVASSFARKKDHGRAEAALIARYGAEVLTGLIPPDRSVSRHQQAEVRT